jgi:hypothetical protein
MRLSNKILIIIFLVGFSLTILGSIPMIFDRDDSYLVPAYIVGALLCLLSILGIRRNFKRTRR